jgi:hypothetical protein
LTVKRLLLSLNLVPVDGLLWREATRNFITAALFGVPQQYVPIGERYKRCHWCNQIASPNTAPKRLTAS